MSKHNYFVKFLIKINIFINSLLKRNLNKLNAANLKKVLINNKVFLTIVLLVILFFDVVFTIGGNNFDINETVYETLLWIIIGCFGISGVQKFAKKNKLLLIEDCAEAVGAIYKNRLVGLDGDCSCFSFFAKVPPPAPMSRQVEQYSSKGFIF